MVDKVKLSFEVSFADSISDSLQKMVIATIKHDVEQVLGNHADLVSGLNYSDVDSVVVGTGNIKYDNVVME